MSHGYLFPMRILTGLANNSCCSILLVCFTEKHVSLSVCVCGAILRMSCYSTIFDLCGIYCGLRKYFKLLLNVAIVDGIQGPKQPWMVEDDDKDADANKV